MAVLTPSATLKRSAQDLIRSALRLVGALRSGIVLSADELADCLLVLNDMMDAFSVDRILIPAISIISKDENQNTLSLVANQQSYTVGNVNQNENFLLPRPSRIERVSIMYSASQQTPVELPMDMYDDVKWQGVANKNVPSLLPQICYIDSSNAVFPDSVLWFWPIPTQANPVLLYAWIVLQQFPDATTQFLFQPSYNELLRYNLAVRLAAEFPCDLQKFQLVKALAEESYARTTGINVKALEAVADEALIGSDGKMGNIFTSTANRTLRN